MRARAFHGACAGKGATLTLIRADVGGAKYVFGGYTSENWLTPEYGEKDSEYESCAFLFSVTSPHAAL